MAGRRSAGPRGEHDRAGFIDLVAGAAEDIVRGQGARALGMRPLAAAIGYAPNSIYNAVGDLGQVVLRVNARTFARLHAALAGAISDQAEPRANALAVADAYLAFVAADPQVWSLVLEHALPQDGTLGETFPDWYAEALGRATGLVDAVLAPLIPEAGERAQAVAALWAALHGLAALSTSGKLAVLTPEPPRALGRLLVGRFLASSS
ncbi:TetR/AcrR family transcriptional regulator [Methylobacterium sp. A54F]